QLSGTASWNGLATELLCETRAIDQFHAEILLAVVLADFIDQTTAKARFWSGPSRPTMSRGVRKLTPGRIAKNIPGSSVRLCQKEPGANFRTCWRQGLWTCAVGIPATIVFLAHKHATTVCPPPVSDNSCGQ